MINKSTNIDMHIHTVFSDGTDNPDELINTLVEKNISVFSVTDHDGVDFYKNIPYIPDGINLYSGIEFSCRAEFGKCHILGYGIDIENEAFKNAIALGQKLRKSKLEKRLISLEEQYGLKFTNDECDYLFSLSAAGKPHIAQILINKGMATDVSGAINTYLKNLPGGNDKLDAEFAINAIVSSGGIPVWAHPLGGEGEKMIDAETFKDRLKVLKSFGIMGLECYYSRYDKFQVEFLCDEAAKEGLLKSGGSDYHGKVKNISLGTLNSDKYFNISSDFITVLEKIKPFKF